MREAATVYITNLNPEHDYSAASRYGHIRPITSGNYAIFNTSRLREEIIRVLLESKEDDYLIISGSSVVAALCLDVWMTMHKKCNLLLRDRKQVQYVPRTWSRDKLLLEIAQARDKWERRKEQR